MMESIQLAQMLADLSDLNAAQESQAAIALVNANKAANPTSPPADASKPSEQLPSRPGLRHHKRTGSGGSAASTGSSFMSRTASPAKFDKYGRRILTPPNTRANSAYGSIPGTPRRDPEVDDDVDRANSLMALYEIRAKLKDQDNNRNLSKLREKIAALHAKQVQGERKDSDGGKMKFTYPRSS
ncbi:hypothetical protein C8A00DRAFT_40688 [Chaetomidium leptoderma]|uniref:Uncharacterized protein n=1 Tax=Chaetomidium leptoderma TaxID=669021 RepID=A0AAN6VS93_9PEZI|nr:hypothetical protein C8A00DRAFT_40688 [Chaetomidium leptoderma]